MRRIPIDFAIAFVIAFAIGSLINFGADKYIKSKENEEVEVEYSSTKPGAAAEKTVPVISSIDEMMNEKVFTFHTDSFLSDYKIIFADDNMYYLVPLPYGETVLIDLYFDHVCLEYDTSGDEDSDEPYFSRTPRLNRDLYSVMPVGKVVKEPLSAETLEVLEQRGLQVTDPSFYIDMRGEYKDFDAEAFQMKAGMVSALAGIAVYLLVRWLMIASGLFAPLFPLRFMRKWKRYVIYNGILYYDENIKEIHRLHKQGNINAAAQEFCRLTNTDMDEAMMAMGYWKELYGEGILHI